MEVNQRLLRFYQRNWNDKFIYTNKITFKNQFSWKRVHEHLTNNSILNNDGNKYNICQVLKIDN